MKPTDIVIVIDKSGSMHPFINDTIGGYNAFLSDQKNIPGEAWVTTLLFDTNHAYFEDGVELEKAINLTPLTYVPSGGTALLDAIGKAISKAEERQAKLPSADQGRVIVAIITDGEENSSKEYTKDQIKDMIDAKTALGWRFDFLSADMQAISDARSYGISAANIMAFASTSEGFTSAYESVNLSTKNYRTQSDDDQ